MKRLLYGLAMAVAALSLVGCGAKPKIPENTLVAGYVDLEKAISHGQDVVELVIDNMPKPYQGKVQEGYDEAMKAFKENVAPYNLKWAAWTLGKGKHGFERTLVIRCDYLEKGKDGKSMIAWAEDGLGAKTRTRFGADVLEGRFPEFGKGMAAFVDEQYVILADDEDTLEKMIRLYRGEGGETSKAFDDLADLGSDTVARIQTADAKSIVEIFDLRHEIEVLAQNCDDDDLADDILDIGNVTLDINFSDDVLGAELTVEAGSKDLAKAVEGVFNILALGNRLGADAVAAVGSFGKFVSPKISRDFDVDGLRDMLKEDTLKELAALVRDGMKVSRSGSTVKVAVEYDTEDLAELIVPKLTEPLYESYEREQEWRRISQQLEELSACELNQLSIKCRDGSLDSEPRCPAGGKYEITTKSGRYSWEREVKVTCSKHGDEKDIDAAREKLLK